MIQHRAASCCVESEKELMSIDSSVGGAEHSIIFFVSKRSYPYSRDTVKVCEFIISYLTIENFVDLLLLKNNYKYRSARTVSFEVEGLKIASAVRTVVNSRIHE